MVVCYYVEFFYSGVPIIPYKIPMIIQLLLFVACFIYTDYTAEAASIWCFTGVSLLIFAIIIPYFVTFPSQLLKKNGKTT